MAESELERRLSAIMFTDIVGYSKMMGEDETGTLLFLKFHDTLIREEIQKHQGRVIKTVGDSFMADFSSAVNAVKCAVTIQKRFQEHSRISGNQRRVRIGIHIGDVVIRDNDIFGDGVNIAARIYPLAEPGGICISSDVYHHIKNKGEFKVASLGVKDLKNIDQKIEIFKVKIEGVGKRKSSSFGAYLVLFVIFLLLGMLWFWDGTPGLEEAKPYILSFITTPTPIPTPTAVPVNSPTVTPTRSPSFTPTATATSTVTPLPTATPIPKRAPKKKTKLPKRITPPAPTDTPIPPAPTPTRLPAPGVNVPPPPDTDVPRTNPPELVPPGGETPTPVARAVPETAPPAQPSGELPAPP